MRMSPALMTGDDAASREGGGRSMIRQWLVSVMVLGLIVTAVGGTGVFAPFTDRATTGTNSVTSAERATAADLTLAYSPLDPESCATATYEDDATSPLVSVADLQVGENRGAYFCLRNVGSGTLSVTVSPIDVVESDVLCTNDEAAAGDTSCGGDAEGELGDVLEVTFSTIVDCDGGNLASPDPGSFIAGTPVISLGSLGPGETLCGFVRLRVPPETSDIDAILSQTDRVTWKFAFDGTT
jgi:predicted ribosomally synthesized peptide with SipW-like signal peptide